MNAIASGRGAAFGLALPATAAADLRPVDFGVQVRVPNSVDPTLARIAVRRVLERSGRETGLEVRVDSEIPISRGLKSSSAVANAVVAASAGALGLKLDPLEVIGLGVDAAFEAQVTLTGAFDDACASLFGGICITDNRTRQLLALDRLPPDLTSVVHVPRRMIPKDGLSGIDFGSIRSEVDAAMHLALRGDYVRAMEANSAAYAPLLGVDEAPAHRARAAGAHAAGISGTGPAIIALAKVGRADAVRKAMEDGEASVRIIPLSTIESRQVIL